MTWDHRYPQPDEASDDMIVDYLAAAVMTAHLTAEEALVFGYYWAEAKRRGLPRRPGLHLGRGRAG